jgi:hypothetical protein
MRTPNLPPARNRPEVTTGFQVSAPPRFARTLEALVKRHPELVELFSQVLLTPSWRRSTSLPTRTPA